MVQEDEKKQADLTAQMLEEELDIAYVELMQVRIASELLLIPVADVSEVIRVQPLTLVPMAPDHLLGVCNVHGHILCVIDPCPVMHLDGELAANSSESRFLCLRHEAMNLALRVDAVLELFRIPESEFAAIKDDESAFFLGNIDVQGQNYRVIDTQALFA